MSNNNTFIEKQVDLIDKIGGSDVFTHIIGYLNPWDTICLRSVCKDFNNIKCVKNHQIEHHYDFYANYWQKHFQRSVIQLYCRPLIDETTSFFKYHTLLRVSMDGISKSRDVIMAIKYLLLYQNQFAKSPMNVDKFTNFSKNVTELEGIYVSNRKCNDGLNKFLKDIITNYGNNDNSHFKLLFFNHCLLGNDGMYNLCKNILKSPRIFTLEILFVSNDETLTDKSMDILFKSVETKLINLKMICLRNTNISDTTCNVIYDFYKRNENNLCFCKSENDNDEKHYPIKLTNINITFNQQITCNGIQKLNGLFFIDDNNKQHKEECFFNSIAIATSVSLSTLEKDVVLSDRFRVLTR